MKEQVTNVAKSISQFWKAMEKKKRITIACIVAGVILVAVILTAILNRPNYVVLYSNLDKSEATEIASIIGDLKVDAQVKSDGTILVPKESENNIRMQLATKGYPKSGYSYDIWTKNVGMFTTDSQQKELKKMQLQERLAATIGELDGIDKAVVTLDIPEKSNTVISTTKSVPSASVVVHLNTGVTLGANQISGITHVVMKSISGLDEANISVVDQNANLLIAGDGNMDDITVEQKRLQFKLNFENQLAANALTLLEPAYGADGVRLKLNSVMNFDKKVSEGTTHTPSVGDSGMLEHEDWSSAYGKDDTSNGIVGVEPNADGSYPTLDGKDDGIRWAEGSGSRNYLVNTLKEQIEKNGAHVENVTVSVVVYKSSITENERQSIMETVANATGTAVKYVSVQNLPKFKDTPEGLPTLDKPFLFGLSLKQALIYIAVALAVVFAILILISVLVSKKAKKKKKLALEAAQAEELAQKQAAEIQKITDVPDTKEQAVRREIGDFAKNSPEIAAQLLKSWLREDGDKK